MAAVNRKGETTAIENDTAPGPSRGFIDRPHLYGGMRPHEEEGTDAFLANFSCLSIDQVTARTAGHLKAQWARKGRTLTIVDCAMAAAAVHNECVLATDNRKDFPMSEVTLYPLP